MRGASHPQAYGTSRRRLTKRAVDEAVWAFPASYARCSEYSEARRCARCASAAASASAVWCWGHCIETPAIQNLLCDDKSSTSNYNARVYVALSRFRSRQALCGTCCALSTPRQFAATAGFWHFFDAGTRSVRRSTHCSRGTATQPARGWLACIHILSPPSQRSVAASSRQQSRQQKNAPAAPLQQKK